MKQTEMFGRAKWIDCPGGEEAPLFLKKFSAKKGEKAVITICGLGFFELKINGRRVSEDLLVPAASNYSYRDMSVWSYPLYDELGFRTYCMKYDISDYFEDGENTLSVMLGTGYYHQYMRDAEGNVDYGTPKLCFIIRKESGEVISDSSVLCHKGYFKRCNLYFGEYQDLTAVPDESGFSQSREIGTPETEFEYNIAPPDRIIDTITKIHPMYYDGGYDYYDIGVNTVGRAVLVCPFKGMHISVDYAEEIGGRDNFGIHFSTDGRYRDEFITDGSDREYHSLFSWQAFRYLRVKDGARPVRIDVIHSDCPVTSEFECSSKNLNDLYNLFVHTQLCNMHSGVPSDCPHRERLGYTGDGQLCCEAAMMMLDSKEFYRKWLYDIADCQAKNSGHIQHTAPPMGGGGGPCGWGGAIVEVPYRYYKAYGDRELLDEFFPKMLFFFDYLESRSDFGLVAREEEGGWCLGDWLPPKEIQVPETFVNSCLYVGFMKRVIEIASILGREDEVKDLPGRIERVTAAVNAAYYSHQQRAYCGDVDGASSIALAAGIGNERVRDKVIGKYKKLGMYDTGIIATEALTGYLYSTGEDELATELMASDKEVSFAHMVRSGATTLWENWNGQSSRNHPMFGAVTKYLFKSLLGIDQPSGSAGYEKVVITPKTVSQLDYARGKITTVKGEIRVSYKKKNGKIDFTVYADPSISARFVYGGIDEAFSGEKTFSCEIKG